MAFSRDDLICMIKSIFLPLWEILLWASSLSVPMQISKTLIFSSSSSASVHADQKTHQANLGHSIFNPATPPTASSSNYSLFSAPLSTSFDPTMDDLIGSENGVFICPEIGPNATKPDPKPKSHLRSRVVRYRCLRPVPLLAPGRKKLVQRGGSAGLTREYVDGRLILTEENNAPVESSGEHFFEARRDNNRLLLNLVVSQSPLHGAVINRDEYRNRRG